MIDREARRLLLLTRIAVEREALTDDLAQLRASASIGRLWRRVLAPSPIISGLFNPRSGGSSRTAGWADTALTLWQRWRRVAPLLGLLAPLLRRRGAAPRHSSRRWPRLLLPALLLVGGTALGRWLARRRPR